MGKSLRGLARLRNQSVVMVLLLLAGATLTSFGAAVGGQWSVARIPEAAPDAHPIWVSLLALVLVGAGAVLGAMIAAAVFAAACVGVYYPSRHRVGDGIHSHIDEVPDEGTSGLADFFDKADLVDDNALGFWR